MDRGRVGTVMGGAYPDSGTDNMSGHTKSGVSLARETNKLGGKETNGMKKLTLAAVLLTFALLTPQSATADMNVNIGMMGDGSVMISPVIYDGMFISGFPGGTWEITVDETWPGEADSTARFDYIWENYFAGNYNPVPGGQHWMGYFNGSTLPTVPQFVFTTPTGVIAGDITFTIMIRDLVSDGILSQDEKHDPSNLSATLNVNPDLGTGAYEDMCGHGSMSTGAFQFINPPTLNSVQIFGQIQLYACPSPVEDSTWGAIKALYE
jgi:hypothetical protein